MEGGLEGCDCEGGGVDWETRADVIDWEGTLAVVVAENEEAPEDDGVAAEEDIS